MRNRLVIITAIVLAFPSAGRAVQLSPADSIAVRAQAEEALWDAWYRLDPDPYKLGRIMRSTVTEDEFREVLGLLDEYSRLIPGDDLIVGHRVGLRVRLGDWLGAMSVLEECRASPWWCLALKGFLHHATGEFADASVTFDSS